MIYARLVDDVVIATTILKPSNLDGWTAVDGSLPPKPVVAEGEVEPRLMLVDGELVWQTGKTEDELSEERRQAYEQECDPYLIAYQGYMLEGKLTEASNCKAAYLEKKAEIRKRFS